MAFKPAICTQCGGRITVDDSKDAGICEFCGTPFVTEKVIHQFITNNNFDGATINVQNGVSSENLYKLARRALEAENRDEILKYYGILKERNPDDWEPVFYYAWYENGDSVCKYIVTAFDLIGKSSDSDEEKVKQYLEMAGFIKVKSRYNLMDRTILLYCAEQMIKTAKVPFLDVAYEYINLYWDLPFERDYSNSGLSDLDIQMKNDSEEFKAQSAFGSWYLETFASLEDSLYKDFVACVWVPALFAIKDKYFEVIDGFSKCGFSEKEITAKKVNFAKRYIKIHGKFTEKKDYEELISLIRTVEPEYKPPFRDSSPESGAREEKTSRFLSIFFNCFLSIASLLLVFGLLATNHIFLSVIFLFIALFLDWGSIGEDSTGCRISLAVLLVIGLFVMF